MPNVDTNISSQAASALSTDRDAPPDGDAIIYAFLTCAQEIDRITPGVTVTVEASAINGIPEFLLTYCDDSPTSMFNGLLATWEPRNRRLWVRDSADANDPQRNRQARDTIFRARFYLLLLRQVQIKWGSRPLIYGATDLL